MGCGLPVVAYDLPVFKEINRDAIDLVGVGDLGDFQTPFEPPDQRQSQSSQGSRRSRSGSEIRLE